MLAKRTISTTLIIVLGVFCLGSWSSADEGFSGSLIKGARKKEATLHRAFPPRVYITGTAISVQGKPGKGIDPAHVSRLTSMLESRLCGNAPRFKPNNSKPETIISLDVTRLEADEKSEKHTFTEQRKTGERKVWNEKKKKYEMQPVYEDVPVTNNYTVVRGAINVSYQAKDMRKRGEILDSESLSARYDENGVVYGDRTLAQRKEKEPGLLDKIFSRNAGKKNMFLNGNGAPSQEEIKQVMLEEIVYQIVARLAPPPEPVEVKLPRGSLEKVSDLGKHGLWQKMLDTLEAMPPKKPKDDSYRLYGIGLAYEAKAYKADTLEETIDLIVKAQLKYDEAYENNPGEKYFLEPQARIKTAREQYEKLKDQQKEDAQSKGQGDSKSLPGNPQNPGSNNDTPKPPSPPDGALTNDEVIELARKGLDEAGLIAHIKQARVVDFDLSTDGTKRLLDSGISSKVIAAMRARQRAKPPVRRKK